MPQVYVVDDEPFMIKVLKRELNRSGYSTSTFENATQFLEALKENTPDLVLMDTELGNCLKGYQACAKARQLYGDSFGIIGMSGNISYRTQWKNQEQMHLYQNHLIYPNLELKLQKQ